LPDGYYQLVEGYLQEKMIYPCCFTSFLDKKVCVNADFSVADFLRKTEHLVEISRAPVQSWLPLATLLIDKENTDG